MADDGGIDAKVESAVAGLADDQRRALALTHSSGHTCAEVARTMGVSESEVKGLLRGALIDLRSELLPPTSGRRVRQLSS